MKLARLMALAALLVTAASAQPDFPVRIFQIRHVPVQQIANALDPFLANYQFKANDALRTIVVKAPEPVLAGIEDAIKRLDVPPPAPQNIELTIYYLLGAQHASDVGTPAPQDLEPVLKQLANLLAYKNYRLLGTLLLRTREGTSTEASGVMPFQDQPGSAQVSIRAAAVTPDLVRIDGLRMGLKVPVRIGFAPPGGMPQLNFFDIGINTNVDVRAGQKVVVGKSNLAGPDQALVLVLSVRIL